jgi:hypothetical protein
MKRYVSAMLLWCFVLGITEAQAQLKIDFGTTTTPVENGFQAYTASHEVADTFTAQSFSAFGTTITITPSWASGAAAAAMQMYDRVADGRYNYAGDMADLIADWIGTDTRQPGNPLTLTISGLPKGTYSWLSYHHDGVDQPPMSWVLLMAAQMVLLPLKESRHSPRRLPAMAVMYSWCSR